MALAVKLECPLRDFASLRSLVVSDSTWKAEFIQPEALAMAQSPPWSARARETEDLCRALLLLVAEQAIPLTVLIRCHIIMSN